jgi:hypothetical protein
MTSPTPRTAEPRKSAHRYRANRAGIVTPQIDDKFAVNTEAEITRLHLCDRIDSARDSQCPTPRRGPFPD